MGSNGRKRSGRERISRIGQSPPLSTAGDAETNPMAGDSTTFYCPMGLS
jgi:hypothetical protein